ncbi:succinylglutamate desuccinylase/aspartoacylase family protein [Mangrovicoccus sp. HB161399]|uniref:succinylglutamate desuccinylase/aspartoacylase family protein n=1 Tax=Mangrovicoccus sp. HB161399 TaxID=2720392 RepID=UPI0015573DE4|nr:succinylglutamate desuccinylase/aspartoacylase family protein [Mangrovicoccus sp. HB161399]
MTDSTDERTLSPASPGAASGPSPAGRELLGFGPENLRSLTVLRFGTPGARPKAYIQAGLHADELPGMLVLRKLAAALEEAAEKGAIAGEIVLVPVANPIGLAQVHGGYLRGRHDDATGENYNRGYPDLAEMISGTIGGSLGADPAANVAAIRAAMGEAIAGLPVRTELDGLRIRLMELAHDADIVLDLHADNEALVHLYTGNALWPAAADLAAEIDARAVLLCDLSGGHPFDEACSGPWWALAAAFPEVPVPPACMAATVELRSNNDVDERLAGDDAAALMRFLKHRGAVAGEAGALPRLLCEAMPLEAMQQVISPVEGIVVYHVRLGDTVRAGEVIATVTDPLGGTTDVEASTDGVLFARHDQPYAWPGKVIGKVAGKDPLPERSGKLLTD